MVNNSISTTRLKNRRDELKKQRQWRNFIIFIRTILTMSLFTGVFWFFTLPNWVIRDSKQVNIEGNNLLSDDEIRSLIPLNYPEPLLKLSTSDLKNNLQDVIPVSNVLITKQILPPSLTIQVVEKKPVAIAVAPKLSTKTKKMTNEAIGYIDKDGVFTSNKLYQNLKNKPQEIPSLKIIGNPQIYLAYWAQLYNLASQSKVKITTIDWQNPSNLILITDLGKIHLGSYTSKFSKQLMMLEKLKVITQKMPKERIAYIDLTDPELPSIKEKNNIKAKKNK